MKARGEYPGDGAPGPGPHELTAAEIENFRQLWNGRVVGATAAELATADVLPSLDPDSPDTARLEVPGTGDNGGEYRCLLSVLSRGNWRPLSLIKPGELDQALLDASAQVEDLRDDCGDGRLAPAKLRERLSLIDAELMVIADRLNRCNPNSGDPGWLPIPDDEPLLGFWSYLPTDECRA